MPNKPSALIRIVFKFVVLRLHRLLQTPKAWGVFGPGISGKPEMKGDKKGDNFNS